jgi:hypothetical protein
MLTLELDLVEATLLREVLEQYLGELRVEIHHTDSSDYKETLKKTEERVRNILSLLPPRP